MALDKLVLCRPAKIIAPITAMASNALVSDINGVCRRADAGGSVQIQ